MTVIYVLAMARENTWLAVLTEEITGLCLSSLDSHRIGVISLSFTWLWGFINLTVRKPTPFL